MGDRSIAAKACTRIAASGGTDESHRVEPAAARREANRVWGALVAIAFALPGSAFAHAEAKRYDTVDGDGATATQPAVSSPEATAPPARQALDDAWWTGPVIANSPAPLPKGRFYAETYLFDARSDGVDAFGSQTYVLYGLTDRTTIGLRPSFGYTRLDGGGDSTRVGVGDLTLHAQYALTTYTPGTRVPAIAVGLETTLPTGRHDRLDRRSNGFGSGAYTTTLAVYAQQYFWLRNGRILRGRLNVGGSHSSRARVRDLSVYGTADGFDGHAQPGASVFIDNAWEYSLTRNWVLAADLYYRHDAPTGVRDARDGAEVRSPAFDTFALVPAVEYNWSARVGMLFGVRLVPARGHNDRSTTPVVALSVLM